MQASRYSVISQSPPIVSGLWGLLGGPPAGTARTHLPPAQSHQLHPPARGRLQPGAGASGPLRDQEEKALDPKYLELWLALFLLVFTELGAQNSL